MSSNVKWNLKMLHDFGGDTLLKAVIQTHDTYEADGLKPGADRWISNTHGRERLLGDVAKQWAKDNDCDADDFPFNTNGVCRMWVAYRKAGDGQKTELKRELSLESLLV